MITKMNHKLAVRVVSFYFPLLSFLFMFAACTAGGEQEVTTGFVTIDGHNLIKPNGEKLLIQGTNLGNWLNPEGYMFGFGRTNSAWMIDLLFKEAVGPDYTAEFWQQFKDNYITRADIDFIAGRSCAHRLHRELVQSEWSVSDSRYARLSWWTDG